MTPEELRGEGEAQALPLLLPGVFLTSSEVRQDPRGSQPVRRPEPRMLTSGPLPTEAVGIIHPQALPFLSEPPTSVSVFSF